MYINITSIDRLKVYRTLIMRCNRYYVSEIDLFNNDFDSIRGNNAIDLELIVLVIIRSLFSNFA